MIKKTVTCDVCGERITNDYYSVRMSVDIESDCTLTSNKYGGDYDFDSECYDEWEKEMDEMWKRLKSKHKSNKKVKVK